MANVVRNAKTTGMGSSLLEAIAHINLECEMMRNQLDQAHQQIAHLQNELDARPSSRPPEFDFSALRRRVAFFCHPDRSGDDLLMRRLNALFDYLEESQYSRTGS